MKIRFKIPHLDPLVLSSILLFFSFAFILASYEFLPWFSSIIDSGTCTENPYVLTGIALGLVVSNFFNFLSACTYTLFSCFTFVGKKSCTSSKEVQDNA